MPMNYEDALNRIALKFRKTAEAAAEAGIIPYQSVNGKWVESPYDGNSWWTGGFWPGLMWQLWTLTGDDFFRQEARRAEGLLTAEFRTFRKLNHDVGFMYLLSCGADAKLTGDEQAETDTLHAASLLMGRFNPAGFIRAWNEPDRVGYAIIDCMMNLTLLYRASRDTGDPRFRNAAKVHADTAMREFLREDGSVSHIIELDPETGKRVLLLECDLRIPSVSDKLRLDREPGLTNLLISREPFQTFIQHSSMAPAIDIITAGSFSPNPSELLSSARMEAVLTQMEQSYDFIIVDLPPVLAVSDTLVMSRLLDGVLLVVRKGIARRRELADTMRRLKLVNARVFGFVFKETTGAKGSYQKKYYDHYRYDSGSSGAAR